MIYETVKDLVDQFENSDIREMNVVIDGLSLYLSKNETNQQVIPTTQLAETKNSSMSIPIVEHDEPKEIEIDTVSNEGTVIKSPIVGVIYTASEPGQSNFVSVGDRVSVGDTLCIIEAMKIMNDVVSDVSGIVTEILIENEEIVEFGQPLFRIS